MGRAVSETVESLRQRCGDLSALAGAQRRVIGRLREKVSEAELELTHALKVEAQLLELLDQANARYVDAAIRAKTEAWRKNGGRDPEPQPSPLPLPSPPGGGSAGAEAALDA